MGSGLPENANQRSQGANAIIARLERELESTREELRKANAVLDAIATKDAGERIVDFSPAADRVIGFTQEAVKGQVLSETINPREYREARVAGLAQNLKSGIASTRGGQLELTALRKDGTILPVDLAINVSTERDGTPFFTTHMRDITDDKQFVQSIVDRDNHITALLNSTAEGIYGIDLNGLCTFANASAARYLGFTSPNDLVGRHMHELIHHTLPSCEPYPLEYCKIYQAFRLGESVHVDDELFWRADGTSFDVEYWSYPQVQEGKIVGCVVSFLDITDRKAAEAERTNRETQLQLALTAGKLGAFQWDIATNDIVWSDELYGIFSYTKDQFNGKLDGFFSVLHADDREQVRQNIDAELASDSDRHDMEFRAVRGSDRRIIWLHSFGKIKRDEQGKPLRLSGLISDISQQREFEHSLVEARALAEAANESKSAFLANMSHEIRTPMTAILGYTDLLADRVQDPEAVAYLRTIRRNGYFLLDIINDILDLSKIEGGMLEIACERFAPNQLVEDVRSIMEVRAVENKLTLEVEYVGLIPKLIESDATRLKQILINLVGNAIKFTKKGGVKVVVSFCDQSLQFDIIDTGIGMSHRQLERLFQPFSQADQTVNREFGGTGLGLAISQRLATMLGGNIVVKSELKKGSRFTVTIATGNITDDQFVKPLLSIKPKVEAPIPVTIQLNCDILVVDDRRDIRFLTRRFLTEVGARVTEAEDGQVAIQTVMQSVSEGKTFDLILLDMQMPRLDGYETAKQLRRLGFTGPIIALTADAMHGDMSRCIASGCNDYLSKPIDKNVMLKLVSDYLSRLPQNAKNET